MFRLGTDSIFTTITCSNQFTAGTGFTWDTDSNTGMFHHSNDSILFTTGSTNAVLIGSNVGIGTVTPTKTLDVVGTLGFTGALLQNGQVFDVSGMSNINAVNFTTGSLSSSRLPTVPTVSPGVYGSTTQVPVLTVDGTGRVTNASNVNINGASLSNLDAATLTAGTLSVSRLPTVPTVTPAAYGTGTSIPITTVDATGRVTTVAPLTIDGAVLSNLNASHFTTGSLNASRLPVVTGVQGSYGSATQVPRLTVDVTGRITSASSVPINGASLSNLDAANITTGSLDSSRLPVTGAQGVHGGVNLVPVLTLDATGRVTAASSVSIDGTSLSNLNAAHITTGSLSASLLPNTGVAAGTYGSATQVPRLTVDVSGRVTSASNIAIDGAVLSNLNATNITTGSLSASRLDNSGVVAGAYGSCNMVPIIAVDNKGRVTSATTASLGASVNTTNFTASNLAASNLRVNTVDTVAAPGYTWVGDTDTGLYHHATDVVGIASAGVARVLVGSNVSVTGDVNYTGSFLKNGADGAGTLSADTSDAATIDLTKVVSVLRNTKASYTLPAGTTAGALKTLVHAFSGNGATATINVQGTGARTITLSQGSTAEFVWSATDGWLST